MSSPDVLPQYGFGEQIDFNTLVLQNHFLFRVYTPKESENDAEHHFVAARFDSRYAASPCECEDQSTSRSATYADVACHMDSATSTSSPFISTSFSLFWSVWEALRRYHFGMKRDISIAVIDARTVREHAVTALQLLRSACPGERHTDYWKWYKYAQEAQLVLVYGHISKASVLSSIPLLTVVRALPSYFLRCDPLSDIKLSDLAWDYTDRKFSYHQLCRAMSGRFVKLTANEMLGDATAAAVRLSMTLLRPWMFTVVTKDPVSARDAACALAFNIAQWPGKWWAREHAEVWMILQAIVATLIDELAVEQLRAQAETSRLEKIVHNLKQKLRRLAVARRNRRSKAVQVTISPHLTATEAQTDLELSQDCFAELSDVDSGYAEPAHHEQTFSLQHQSSSYFPFLPLASVVERATTMSPVHAVITHPCFTARSELMSSWGFPRGSAVCGPPACSDDSDDDMSDGSDVEEPAPLVVACHDGTASARAHPAIEAASYVATGFLLGALLAFSFIASERRMVMMHMHGAVPT